MRGMPVPNWGVTSKSASQLPGLEFTMIVRLFDRFGQSLLPKGQRRLISAFQGGSHVHVACTQEFENTFLPSAVAIQ